MSERMRPAGRHDAVISAVAMVAMLAGLDAAYRWSAVSRRLSSESLYVIKPEAFASGAGADVVITGDSRILHGFDPKAAEQTVRVELGRSIVAYNAGLPAATPMAQLAWVRRFLAAPRLPQVVILSISPYMFSSRIALVASRESLATMYRMRDIPAMVRAGAGAEDMASVFFASALESVRQRPRLLEITLDLGGYHDVASAGVQGFLANDEVDPAVQESHAHGRAIGYRVEMWRPDAHFGNEQIGYFTEALRELQAAHVRTVVMNSPSASQLELAYGPRSIYDEHIAFIRGAAERFGATYFDAKSSPAVHDEDYRDGDHLAANGAARFTAWLTHEAVVPLMASPSAPIGARAGCRTVFDFETPGLPGWSLQGDVAPEPTSVQGRHGQRPVFGYRGHAFFNSWGAGPGGGDRSEIEAVSPAFVVDGERVELRVGGGSRGDVGVALVVGGQEVARTQGRDDETMREVVWTTSALRGQTATIRVWDHATSNWGHITVDDVAVCP